MVDTVYMHGQAGSPSSGTKFTVSWSRIEDFLRGNPDRYSESDANLKPHERCDFEITEHGIEVTVR